MIWRSSGMFFRATGLQVHGKSPGKRCCSETYIRGIRKELTISLCTLILVYEVALLQFRRLWGIVIAHYKVFRAWTSVVND